MLTFYQNHYGYNDLYGLYLMMKRGKEYMEEGCDHMCKNCYYKHACYDVSKLVKYLKELLTNGTYYSTDTSEND